MCMGSATRNCDGSPKSKSSSKIGVHKPKIRQGGATRTVSPFGSPKVRISFSSRSR